MPSSLACILSYGLLCAEATVPVAEVPPATPVASAPAETTPPAPPSLPMPAPPAASEAEEPAASPGSATAVLARVQSFYDQTSDLETRFTQTYVHPVYGTKKVSKGVLKARKPGLMVWDYAEAADADYWVDQNQVWVVEEATKQVMRRDVDTSDIAGANKFLFGGESLTKDFLVKLAEDSLDKRYGKPGHTTVRLKPKKDNPHYRELLLVVDDGTGRVDAFVVLNRDQSTNAFELTRLSRNQGVPESALRFQKPAGYKQIEAP